MSVVSPDKPREQSKTPAARLEESLRDLVQEEMGIKRAADQQPIATRADAFWLFLCVADVALLLWLIPDTMLGNKRLEMLGKLVTWIGGSLFVLGYVWFRDHFLAFVRRRAFKIMLLVLPFVLIPAFITQIPIFPISASVDPPKAEVEIDKQAVQLNDIRLPLKTHRILVKVKGEGEKVYEKPFNLTKADIWRTWWRDEHPFWPIYFEPGIDFDPAPESIELIKEEKKFDREFRSSPPKLTFQKENKGNTDHAGTWTENGNMIFSWPYPPGVKGGLKFNLPYGKYQLTASFADKQGCDKKTTIEFMSGPGIESEFKVVERKCSGPKE